MNLSRKIANGYRPAFVRAIAFAFAATVAAGVGARTSTPSPSATPAEPSVEAAVIDALLAGRDARPAVADALADTDIASRTKARRASQSPSAFGGYVRSVHDTQRALAALAQSTTATSTRAARDGVKSALHSLRVQHLLVEARVAQIDRELIDARLPAIALLRWNVHRAAIVARVQRIAQAAKTLDDALAANAPSAVAPRAVLAELDGLLSAETAANAAPVYGADTLPVHRPRLIVREPATTPVVVPSYADSTTDVVPTAADLSGGDDAATSPAILAKAASLDHDYVRIVDFVRTQVRTQWYAGAQKGADATLNTLAGNDVDQASLLIALLRASSAPARYVRGVLEVPVEDLAESIGVRLDKVGQALGAAGIANRPVIRGGRVAAYAIEHVFVSARLPFSNYRGSVADLEGSTWVPLAPALKSHSLVAATGAMATAAISANTFVTSYLAQVQTALPLASLRAQVSAALAGRTPPLDYDAQLARHVVDAEALELLPASLPAATVAITGEFATLPDALRQQARIVVREGAAATSPVALELRLPIAQLAGRRVTLSYAPASIDDGAIADRYGGLGATPPYLIRARPVLHIAGRPAQAGTGDLEIGVPHRVEVTFDGPAGSTTVVQQLIGGGISALVVDVQNDRPAIQPDTETLIGESESPAASLLANFGARYLASWDAADDDLAALIGVSVVRPFPSLAFVINQYKVERVAGVVDTMAWRGVALDAALRPVEPFAQSAVASAEADWTTLSSLHGSALEHALFEEQWAVDSISADKALALATAQGIPVLTLTGATGTSGLHLPGDVVTEIAAWLARGYVVDVPRDPITLQAWTGAAWRVRSLTTGEAGYFIAGSLAGGSTAMPPALWYFQDLAQLLANPYAAAPNEDPLAGVVLTLDENSQNQDGTVNQELEEPLRAVVLDAAGRPVQGAQVTFAVVLGTGKLIADDGERSSVTVSTDSRGTATAKLKLGEKTGSRGHYEQEPDQEYPQWVGANSVEVTALAQVGVLYSGQPFRANSWPDAPSKILVSGDPSRPLYPGISYRSFAARAADQFDNEISNETIAMSASTSYTTPACYEAGDPEVPTIDATLFEAGQCPVHAPRLTGNGCATASISVVSRPLGAPFSVVPPNTGLANVNIVLTSGGATRTLAMRTDDWFNPCPHRRRINAAVGWVHVPNNGLIAWLEDSLYPFDAALPGDVLPVPMQADVLTTYVEVGNHPVVEWEPVTGAEFHFNLTGGSGENVRELGGGTYLFDLRAGPTPGPIMGPILITWGPNEVELVRRLEGASDDVAPAGGYQYIHGWAVDPRKPEVTPERVPLSPFSVTDESLSVRAAIHPDEYYAAPMQLQLLEEGDVLSECNVMVGSAETDCLFPRGFAVDIEKDYSVKSIINDGTPFRMESEETELKFGLSVIAGFGVIPPRDPNTPPAGPGGLGDVLGLIQNRYPKRIKIKQDVDLPTGYVCAQSTKFGFVTSRRAKISLAFYKLDSFGEPSPFVAWQALDAEEKEEGLHEVAITTDDLPIGEFAYRIKSELDDGTVEEYQGAASHAVNRRDAIPLAHPFVKGVDLHSGNAVVSEDDIVLGGRGPGIKLSRSYSSNSGDEEGFFGRGWNADLDSQVQSNECGQRIVTGFAGQGQRFVPAGLTSDGALRYEPLGGYHGTLLQRGLEYDFYSKNGTRYHFGQFTLGGPRLSFIEDTSGNRVVYEYELNQGEPRVSTISDSSGRKIDLTYTTKRVEYESAGFTITDVFTVVTSARGPGGLVIGYEYDDKANLVRVVRVDGQPGSRVSKYEYRDFGGIYSADPNGEPMYTHFGHRLLKVIDGVNNATREYDYQLGWSGTPTDDGILFTPSQFATLVKEPDGGRTEIRYDGLRGMGPVSSTVKDARGKTTSYAMNKYGAAETVTDAAGTTTTEWDFLSYQPKNTTDAVGTRTAYTYDAHGNKISETITHAAGTISRTWTFAQPTEFSPPYIKDRAATYKDGRGNTTTYVHDSKGRLQSTTRGGVTESDAYDASGDRVSHTDGSGATWLYRYDANGYLAGTNDPAGGVTSATYDARGRMVSQVDGNGHATTMSYDARDRVRIVTHPGGATTKYDYFDAQNMVRETNPRAIQTLTTRDLMGRVLEERRGFDRRSMAYDYNGNLLNETDWGGHVTTYVYDDANRMTSKNEPEGRTTTYTHDALGHVLSETVGAGADARETQYAYAHPLYLRTLVSRRVATGNADVTTRYDGNGNAIEVRDPLSRVTTMTYDERDRMTVKAEPLGRTTTNTYDGADRKLTETLANPAGSGAQLRTFVYDGVGRVTRTTDATGAATQIAYDDNGNVVSRTDARGGAITYVYDARNFLLEQKGPEANQRTTYTVDPNGNRVTEAWANGRTLTHAYDNFDRRTGSTDQLGQVDNLVLDAEGLVRVRRDADDRVTSYEYNELHQLTAERLPLARSIINTYNVHGDVLTTTDAESHTTTNVYDALGRKTHTTLPGVGEIGYGYDLAGNLVRQTNARGQATTYTYDDLNHRTTQTDPSDGNPAYAQTFVNDQAGNLVAHTDRRGILTVSAFDRENRPLATMRDNRMLETLERDATGNVVKRIDALSRTTSYVVDKAGRTTVENRPLGATLRTTYDGVGDVLTSIDADGRTTTNTYTKRRKLASTELAGETTTFTYDGAGHRTSMTRPNGAATRVDYGYDEAGRLQTVSSATTGTTTFGYDRDDNRTSIRDANSHTTTYGYDARHFLRSKIYPGGASYTFVPDADGNATSTTTPNGRTIGSTWDALGRLTGNTFGGAVAGEVSSSTMAYDGNGNLTSRSETIDGSARTESRTYDAFDRVEHVTDALGRHVDYAYDAVGNRTRLRDHAGQETTWSYDALNRNRSVTVPGQGTTSLDYTAAGLPTGVTRPDGSTTTTTYDDAGRVASIVHAKGGGTIASYVYRYDLDGNRLEQRETNGAAEEVTSYRYDDADRLTRTIEPGRTTEYVLDHVGNRIDETVKDAVGTTISHSTLTYNARDQLTHRSDSVRGIEIELGYDASGNQTSQTHGADVRTFAFDARNRMLRFTQPSASPVVFDYDADGMRVRKTQGASETRFQYDERSLLAETNAVGNTLTRYHYSAGQVISRTESGTTPTHRHYLLDALRTPIALLTQQGAVSARTSYDAWGEIRRQVGTGGATITPDRDGAHAELPSTDGQPIGFTGYYKDGESGFYYAKARYYDPAIARFTSEDPESGTDLKPPSLHRYLYAAANPAFFVDPDGREIWNAQMSRLNQMVYEKDPVRLAQIQREYHEEDIRASARLAVTGRRAVDTVKGLWTLALTLGQATIEDKTHGMINFGARDRLAHAGSEMVQSALHPIDRIYTPIKKKFEQADELDRQGRIYEAETIRHEGTLDTVEVVTTVAGAPSAIRSVGRTVARTLGRSAAAPAAVALEAEASVAGKLTPPGAASNVAEGAEMSPVLKAGQEVDAGAAPIVNDQPSPSFDRKAILEGHQDHHIISDKNALTKEHELLDAAEFDLQSRQNKIFLPKDADGHPTRSIHNGRHTTSVSRDLATKMDQILEAGREAGWTKAEYRAALDALIAEERAALKAGDRALNKNAREWAKKKDDE